MKKTFVFDPEQGKMVEIERQPAPMYRGDAIDPTCVDAAIPRALKALCSDDRYRNMGKKELAQAMGFNNLETVKRCWQPYMCLLFLLASLFSGFSQTPPYLTPGVVFTNGALVTAAQLEALVANATINYPFYSSATGEQVLGQGDTILVLTGGNQFRKISAQAFLLNNTNWFASAAGNTNVTTNGVFLVFDGGTNGQLYQVSITNLFPEAVGYFGTPAWYTWPSAYLGTNWQTWMVMTNVNGSTNGPLTNAYPINDADVVPWYNSAANSNEVATWGTLKSSVTNVGVKGATRNLVIRTDSYYQSFSSGQMIVSADEIVVKCNTNSFTNGPPIGASRLIKGLSNTVILSYSPVAPWNGFDETYLGASWPNWVYIFAASDGTNDGVILSTNYTGVTMTTVIPYVTLIGAVEGQIGGTYGPYLQLDRQGYIFPTGLINGFVETNYDNTGMWATNNGNGTNYQPAFALLVPPIAKTVSGVAGQSDTSGECALMLSSSGLMPVGAFGADYVGEITIIGYPAPALHNGFTHSSPFTVPVSPGSNNVSSPMLLWRSDSYSKTNRVVITGYGL